MPRPESDTEYQKLPDQYRKGMKRYIEEGILPGSFLTMVLWNDLISAVSHCSGPLEDMKAVVMWLYNEAPSAWTMTPAFRLYLSGYVQITATMRDTRRRSGGAGWFPEC